MTFEEILKIEPYSLGKDEKEKLLTERLVELTEKHKKDCPEYAHILDTIGYSKAKITTFKDIPFLPVRMFKELDLKSVVAENIVKTMTSSGTTGQRVSKIYLDKETSSNQQKTMVKIVNNFTGSSRMPMIILDCPSVVKDRKMFSARGAGILGFSMFGSKKVYALGDDMKLDVDALREFLDKWQGQTIFMFGFTFMIWQYFYKELVRLKEEGISFDLSNAVLIHGGGWKKLVSEAVSPEEFHQRLKDVCGLDRIHDYYGMVEQTGCIYMQCECGHLHASIFSDVIARRPKDFSVCDFGEPGILQVVSTIPESYPGHSLLTEDEGVILGEDDCPCGRKGKYFKINGRIAKAEIRGCSDTFATDYTNKLKKSECNEASVINKLRFLVGDEKVLNYQTEVSPMKIFDEAVISFLSDLSKELMLRRDAKAFSDVVSLGFWLRSSSINMLKNRFSMDDGNEHVGRGCVFHIAPSNVPVNFAYSLFSGLICGNANVVRVPSKDFPQVRIIADSINKTLESHEEIRKYICLVQYERDSEINDYLSSMCDARVIWGGDNTIAELRKSELPPRATEITFADRYSLAVIDSDYYTSSDDKERMALDFYNDTYLTDQNACTSPRVVVWMGTKKEEAKEIFWKKLSKVLAERYEFQPIMSVDKLSQLCLVAAAEDVCESHLVESADNLIVRVKVEKLCPKLMNYRGNCGYFYEYDCNDIMEIREFCNDTHCQTMSIVGNKDIAKPLLQSGIKGIDRVSIVGHTMDFDLSWDGYNLVERLSRTINM